MILTEEERLVQSKLTEHYLQLQEINQYILSSISLNVVTEEILSSYYNHSSVGIYNKNLQIDSAGQYMQPIASSCVFAISGMLCGLYLAVPLTVMSYAALNTYVANKVYSALEKYQSEIQAAATFYLSNPDALDATFYRDCFVKLSSRSDLTKKEFFKCFRQLFVCLHDNFHNLPFVDENINEPAPEDKETVKNNDSSLIILSDDILFNNDELNKLCNEAGCVTEVELLATISYCEQICDNSSDLALVEQISNEVLPILRKALDFQTKN